MTCDRPAMDLLAAEASLHQRRILLRVISSSWLTARFDLARFPTTDCSWLPAAHAAMMSLTFFTEADT